jgi:iron complex outermembrane receptor protein
MHKLMLKPAAIAVALAMAAPSLAQQAEQHLPEVRVKGNTVEETATGPVQGYRARRSASGTKTDTPLHETPQSISVITRERMEDQGVQTVQDALRYSAGVRSDAYGYDNRGDWALVRGTSFVQYQDGLRMLFGFYNNIRPDPYTLERVEVVRGPASVLYGQGGFGGLVNLVSKRPQAEAQREIVGEIGNHNRKQIAFDATGSLNADGTLLYRLIALGRDSGSQVDFVPDDRQVIAPALTWKPNVGTSFTLYANLQEDLSGSSVGFFPWVGTLYAPPLGRIPTNTFISEPGYDEYLADQKVIGYELSHQLNETLTLRQNLRYSDSEVSYRSLYSRFPVPRLNPDNRTLNRTIIHQINQAETLTADTQVQAKWNAGGFDNTTLFGIDYQNSTLGGASGRGNAPAIDVYAPVYGNFTPVAIAAIADTEQRQTGIYLQHQFKYDQRWLGVVGLRQDWAKSDTANTPASRLDTDAVTMRLGGGYLAAGGWMPYASHSESFVPVGGVNLFGVAYQPQTSEQKEIGIKYQPPGSNNSYTVALFDIKETNRRTADPANPGNSIQVGEARSKGFELEAQTALTRNLDMVAAYTWTDAKVTRDNSAQQGKRIATVPEHSASVWGRQRFSIGETSGFMAGLGLRYIGASWDGLDTVRTPSVTLIDAMLGYEKGPWRITLSASNLTDKEHVSTCLSRGDCFYGSRRTVLLRTAYRF